MHLVMDTLISHELELTIPAGEVAARLAEWNRLQTARTRSDYVKGIAEFVGLELIDYDNADVRRDPKGNFSAKIRSEHWTMRRPK